MQPLEIWKATRAELEMQMTKATFNTWLSDATFHRWEERVFYISVANEYAKDWLENRLKETILRTLNAIDGHEHQIEFVVNADTPPTPPNPPPVETPIGLEDSPQTLFEGIPADNSDFTKIPNELIDNIYPFIKPSTERLINVTMRQTSGTVISKNGNRREWWFTNSNAAINQCNLSRSAFYSALEEAEEKGLLIKWEVPKSDRKILSRKYGMAVKFGLRPRWVGDEI